MDTDDRIEELLENLQYLLDNLTAAYKTGELLLNYAYANFDDELKGIIISYLKKLNSSDSEEGIDYYHILNEDGLQWLLYYTEYQICNLLGETVEDAEVFTKFQELKTRLNEVKEQILEIAEQMEALLGDEFIEGNYEDDEDDEDNEDNEDNDFF